MKQILIGMGLVALLVVPASAVPKPDKAEKRAAIAQCKAERGKARATREAFRDRYHGFGRCVRKKVAAGEAGNAARINPAKECKAERAADPAAFRTKYATNEDGENAFGKCVSGRASGDRPEKDPPDPPGRAGPPNPAKECAAERNAIGPEAFAAKYGTNPDRRNAFGKCVSGKSDGP